MLKIFRQYYPIRNIFFVLGEGMVIFFSIIISSWLVMGSDFWLIEEAFLFKAVFISLTLQACLYYNDLYEFKSSISFGELGLRLLQALGVAAVVLALVYLIFPKVVIGQGIFEIALAILVLLVASWRYSYALILNRGLFNEKIILLGSGDLGASIFREIRGKKDCGYTVSLVICEDHECIDYDNVQSTQPKPDGQSDLVHKVASLGVKKIVVALAEKRGRMPIQDLLKCRLAGIEVMDGNTFFEMLTGKLVVKNLNPAWLIFSEGFQKLVVTRILKRISDVLMALVLLVLLAPLLAAVAIAIKLDSQGPVLFSQERLGRGRRAYKIYKFRSMVENAEKDSGPVWAKEGDSRVTRVGRIMRKLRIDELPQFWNVLKGEMSFVGPRPEREVFIKELEKQIPYYGARLSVKPGITGWAQINYPYGASVEDAVEKLNYDLFYIKNMSFFMDLLIILRTIKIVLFGRGAR
jgi:sugar transferase (PEP-CTERM system associated)